jgi:hypothetical protein
MNFFLLAAEPTQAEAVGALLSSGTFKGVVTVILLVVVVLALAAPSLLAKIKAMAQAWVDERLGQLRGGLPLRHATTASGEQSITPPSEIIDVDKLVQQRTAQLKSVAPRAEAELRLKWMESGFNDQRAQADYISVLEQRLEQAVKGPALKPPATVIPPATPPVPPEA